MDHRTEVREFLTARRAGLKPEDVGLPRFGGRRHVKGLRREEVAMLAGVSTEYYARLERGDIAGASTQVLEALADALRLDETERDHLANLAQSASARPRARRPSPPSGALRPGVRAALDAITGAPAFVRNGALDVLGANELGRAFYAPMFARSATPNLATFTVFDPAAQAFYPDWIRAVDNTVAILRHEAGRNPFDKRITEVIGELSTRSEVFRDRWANAIVHRHDAGYKVAVHPVVGEISLHLVGTEMIADPGLSLMIYSAEAGSAAEEKLRLLAAWSATAASERAGEGATADR
ncbi:helix-turn-helix transcriptional regulator [Microbacterium sp. ZXX196]|uniref:helix-turn-helix transcriptional regulator n=1 Tax=Microbacterium sp. ZXX196 TaxID=2609291 RepID=UPI0012BA24FF|nr:helix-turn-helix transcriptional regulator [Microbacterium sp. ZXX196]MTE23224.1 helix-turn-helix domain-containing protein [Microbacterium sp. ZXX196]